MSEWVTEPLGKLVDFQKGKKVNTSPFRLPGYRRYLGAGSLGGGIHDGYASCTNAVIARKDDILMLWDGERSGLVGYNLEGVVASTVTKLVCSGAVKSGYLYFYLDGRFDWIQNRRTGTGVPHVPKDLYRILNVSYPVSGDYQKKITLILQTIDQVIEDTEANIKKYQKIKTGLMHDLFTRGIGEDGKLRPNREEEPELYKETKIGWVPMEWEVDTLENMLAPVSNNIRSGPFGSALLKSELVDVGIPFLGIDNIFKERFISNYKRFVSEKKYNELIKYAVRPQDVVITIMGTVGRCAIVPENIGKALSSKHLWTMSFDQRSVVPELICWQLNYASWVKAWFRRETQGGIMDAIQSKTLRTLRLPKPPLPEQKKIFDRYSAITEKIRSEEKKQFKLLIQKQGLMHDLLAETVPVKVNNNEVVNA